MPIAPAIVWQDRRTSAVCDELRAAGREPEVTAKTGLLLDPYFSATKIAWLLDAIPGARERAERGELAFGTVDAWLIWNLTAGAVHATDHTNASRTLLLDLATLDWDDELLALFRVPRAVLPELRPSIGSVRRTPNRRFSARRFQSAAWRAINRRRSSDKPVSVRDWLRIPSARARSCCSTPANASRIQPAVCWRRSHLRRQAARHATRLKVRSS